jgi:hypothetical protein
MAKLIKADETIIKDVDISTLKQMQNLVGGYIEIVHISAEEMLIVNEEGLLFGYLPFNSEASELAGITILGDAILIYTKRNEITIFDISNRQLIYLQNQMNEDKFYEDRERELHEDPSMYDEYELCETDPNDYPEDEIVLVSSKTQAQEMLKDFKKSLSVILKDYRNEARDF